MEEIINYAQKTREEIHSYWKEPWDGKNKPTDYVPLLERSQFLLGIISAYASQAKILEIGCNVGRNLNCLYNSGYQNLTGIEISKNAIEELAKQFPQLIENCNIINGSIEDQIINFNSNGFDIVFTMAVLVHVHPESEWIFKEMVNITGKYLIVIEDEVRTTWRHFSRKYKEIFESYNMQQILEARYIPGIDCNYVCRVFKKVI